MGDRDFLIRLLDLDPDFAISLKYATSDNFTGRRIYDFDDCYLNAGTAAMLVRAKNIFKKDGYGVKVWDAYRPVRAQKKLFEIMPVNEYVAEPPDFSKPIEYEYSHMNGMSVDVTLLDPEGLEVEMPTGFDDFTEMASLACERIPPAARKNAQYLRDVMESVGFRAYEKEWWHFNDVLNPATPYSDLAFGG